MSILGHNPRADRCRLFQKVGVQFQECDYQLQRTRGMQYVIEDTKTQVEHECCRL